MNQNQTPADRHQNNQCREVVGSHCHCTLEYGMPEGQRRECRICDLSADERRAADFTAQPGDQLLEYGSGVEGVAGWGGDLVDVTVDVDLDNPLQIGLAHTNSCGDSDGLALTIEQAQELMVALQGAIDTARLNRTRM